MAKVMLVEDDNNLREIYGARLAAEGYEIVSAQDGEEALALAVKERPDLIISDVMMPKVSGFDMLDILRTTPETKHAKIVMMTALGQAEDKQRAEKLGADRYLVKSQVTLEDVVRVAQELLSSAEQAPLPASVQTAETPPQPKPNTTTPLTSAIPVATPPAQTEQSTPAQNTENAAAPTVPASPAADTQASPPVSEPPTSPAPSNPVPSATPTATSQAAAQSPPAPAAPSTPPEDTTGSNTTVQAVDDSSAPPKTIPVVTADEPAPQAQTTQQENNSDAAVPATATQAVAPEQPKEEPPAAAVPAETTAATPPAPTATASPDAIANTTAEEEAVLHSQIEDFITQNPTITTSAEEPASTPKTNTAPVKEESEADKTMAAAMDQLVKKPGEPNAAEPRPTPPAPDDTDSGIGGRRKKVIQPLDDFTPVAPDLNELLAKEDAATDNTPPPANAVITPNGSPSVSQETGTIIAPNTGDSSQQTTDPNTIAL